MQNLCKDEKAKVGEAFGHTNMVALTGDNWTSLSKFWIIAIIINIHLRKASI